MLTFVLICCISCCVVVGQQLSDTTDGIPLTRSTGCVFVAHQGGYVCVCNGTVKGENCDRNGSANSQWLINTNQRKERRRKRIRREKNGTEPLGKDNVRLAGTGSGRTQGRVEVQIQGVWGTICDDDFDSRDARVLCRMLGLNTTYARAHGGAWFGEGNETMPIWLSNLWCEGDESSISDCNNGIIPANGITNCYHSRDAGISCETEPLGKDDVRLTGTGSGRTQGRVEVQIQGVWSTICDDGFDTREARVLCRMLGLNTTYAWAYGDARFGEGNSTMPIWLANLRCEGGESSISECDQDAISAGDFGYCDHSRDAGISCETEPLGKAHVRLAGTGSSHTQGRVEVQIMGTWGTVCDYNNNFGISDAMVFCRMLGLNTTSASVYTVARFGQGNSTMLIWIGNMQCEGSEFSISDCYHETILATYCDHSMDAGISCETGKN
ncbi:hypothetical protein ScPMuIL_009817 [Solemya velum]